MIRLRQIVLVAEDLQASVTELRKRLGLAEGVSQDMSHLALDHEVLTVGDTFIEVVSPLDPNDESAASKALRRSGDGGYMVVLQVSDLDVVTERAGSAGVRIVHTGEVHGARFAQYHPKDVATLLETDQVDPWESWHFAPKIFERRRDDVTLGIVGVTVAVPDVADAAPRWAELVDRPVSDDHVIELDEGRVALVPAGERTGLLAVEVAARDDALWGTTAVLGGVEFVFVPPGTTRP